MGINSDEKRLSVLQFALDQCGVASAEYAIMEQVDDRLCIDKIDGVWTVYFRERGTNHIWGSFRNSAAAASYFFWELTRPQKYTDYLKQYEKMTEIG